jgi:beta-N-acetylhexosaminidase
VPFRAAIAAGVRAVMPGHLLVPALDAEHPATVSRRIVTDLLRSELGFTGLVVTDALDMGGAGGPAAIPASVAGALAAGADLCCLGPDNDEALVDACVDAVLAAVAAGELAVDRLVDAAARVAALRSTASPRGPEPATEHATEPVAVPHVESHEPAGARSALAAVGAEAAERALRVDGALPELPLLPRAHVVELDRPANIAAGAVPWGVGAPLRALAATATTARVPEGDDHAVASTLVAAADRPLVVVVRDAHRRPAQAATLATLAAARPDAVVVDMGWPGNPTDRPAVATWITTPGASRASGEAAARVLAGAPTAMSPATSGRTSRG